MKRFRTIDLAPLPTTTQPSLAAGVLLTCAVIASFFPNPNFRFMVMFTGVMIGFFAVYRPRQTVRDPQGGVFRGRIESKLGPFALRVVDGELRACPFVVRLDDGRVALVDSDALVMESSSESVDVGARIELTGNPELTPYAPEGYRGAAALRFRGRASEPVGIRA